MANLGLAGVSSTMALSFPPVLDATVLDRYLAGTSTDIEHAVVDRWMVADPMRMATIHALRAVLSGEVGDVPVDVDAEWTRLKARWAHPPRRTDMSSRGKRVDIGRRPLSQRLWYAVPAVVLGIVAFVAGRDTIAPHIGMRAVTQMKETTYSTANGQRANITLPDGSIVSLNVASRLDVPADYAAGNRVLWLRGEALFTVRHHEGTPFTVVAGATAVRVLGTTFMVRHYTTDSTTTVAVRDGKVGVHSAVLTAAQLAEMSPAGAMRVRSASTAQFSFATGVLTLNDMPFLSAIAELDRWYDADIRSSDPALAMQRITGEYGNGSLAELADILTGTFNVRVVRSGRVLTLYPR